MDYSKKFMMTQDQSVGNLLLANGFHLVSHISGVYTFLNEIPANFNFSSIDKSKIYYTNILHI